MKFIIGILVVSLFFLYIYLALPSMEEGACNEYLEFSKLELNGVVIAKYFDSMQHSYPTVIIKNIDSAKLITLNLVNDTSNSYLSIIVDDAIYKPKNQIEIMVKRKGGNSFTKKIDFGCKENILQKIKLNR
ncbi:MAG: hypothetical protein C5B52_05080 [Bacteroidetes bacterium]|nr:MAG: hypothetical protein C5B52_05080 [Bacteroidota bacterium]